MVDCKAHVLETLSRSTSVVLWTNTMGLFTEHGIALCPNNPMQLIT